jgi:acetolactate synthase-1/2/3 large subunit
MATSRKPASNLWTFAPVNLADVANDFGAIGLRVERPAELPDALSTALAANKPVLIDALTDREALGPLPWD